MSLMTTSCEDWQVLLVLYRNWDDTRLCNHHHSAAWSGVQGWQLTQIASSKWGCHVLPFLYLGPIPNLPLLSAKKRFFARGVRCHFGLWSVSGGAWCISWWRCSCLVGGRGPVVACATCKREVTGSITRWVEFAVMAFTHTWTLSTQE